MKRLVWIIICIAIAAVFGYLNNHGTRVKFANDCSVLYKDGATEADARAVGDYLVKIGIFGKQKADVQLTKKDGKFQVRFLVKEGVDKDEGTMNALALIGARLKAFALNNQPVQVDVLSEKWDLLKTLPDLNLGQGVPVGTDGGVFFTDAALEPQARKLAEWINSKVKEGNTVICKLEKKGDGYDVSMLVEAGDDKKPQAEQTYRSIGEAFSGVLGAPVTMIMVDGAFKTLKTIAAAPPPPKPEAQPPAAAEQPPAAEPPAEEKPSEDKQEGFKEE